MKKINRLFSIVMLVAAALFTACEPHGPLPDYSNEQKQEKPDPEPEQPVSKLSKELQQANTFAADLMSIYYLWIKEIGDDINKLDPMTCEDPISMVKQIRYHENKKEVDHWTRLTDDLESMTSSAEGLGLTYGYDLQLGNISNKPGVYFMLVTYVAKDSPAEKAGIKRGDIFLSLDGKDITSSNYYDAFNTASVKVGITHIVVEGNKRYLGEIEKEVTLKAEDMWEDPILLSKTFDIDGKKVGYLVYNSFDVKSMETLPEVFAQFKEEGVKELILDLRYNGGGFVKTECELASLIAPMANVAAKDVFQTEVMNSILTEAWKDEDFNTYFSLKHNYKDSKYNISVDITDSKPEIEKFYAIVTGGSASASEGLIVGLGPYMDITLIGEQTYGKYCAGYMMSPEDLYGTKTSYYTDIKNWGLYVMFSKFADKNKKNAAMPDGIPVDIEVDDDPTDGYQFGDENETMLKAALQAAGKPGTKASSFTSKPIPTEFIEHGMPRGMLIKTNPPRPFFQD